MRQRYWFFPAVVSVISTALAGCGNDDGRAKPKPGKQVVVTKFPAEFIPRGVAVDGQGTVYTSGWDGTRFVMATIPKKGNPTFRPIPCATAEGLKEPVGGSMAAAPDGTVFWAMDRQHRVVKLGPNETGDCFAGTGKAGFSGDNGPAIQADLNAVSSLAYDPEKRNLYIADSENQRLRKVDPLGVITTVAEYRGWNQRWEGEEGYIAFDGRRGRLYAMEGGKLSYRTRAGETRQIDSPIVSYELHGLAADPTGADLVITAGCRLSRVSDDGNLTTVPGGKEKGSSCMYQHVVDAEGNIWVISGGQLVVIGPKR